MSLRTKLLLSISAVMIVVSLLITLVLWLDAFAQNQREMQRNTEFLTRLVHEWIVEEAPLKVAISDMKWENLSRRMLRSTLIENWVVAGMEDGQLRIYSTSSPDPAGVLAREGAPLRQVLDEVLHRNSPSRVYGNRVYTRLRTAHGWDLACRFELGPAALPAVLDLTASGEVLLIMGLGTVLLLVVLYVLLDRFVLRPLGALVEASERVARGNFGEPIREIAGYDEMARMINAFNLMLYRIAEHHGTMREEVRQAKVRITETEKLLFAAQRLSTTGTLAAGIAHEINNPLGGMINAARSVRQPGLDGSKRDEYLALIEDGLRRVKEIVAKVLRFSPRTLEPAPVGLRQVCDRAVAFLEHQLTAKRIRLRNEVDGSLPDVLGDALELQQAMLNVILNAVDAVEADRGEIVVSSLREEPDSVRLTVRDNGCGMDGEQLLRCLDPFYTTKEVGRGTGLGLSIAHNIVTNHGGRLEMESVPGEGTRVSMIFSLPAGAPGGGRSTPGTRPAVHS